MVVQFVIGSLIDIGASAGIEGFSECNSCEATSWNFGGLIFGQYGGIQVHFVGGEFDGATLGLGAGLTTPISYTVSWEQFRRRYIGHRSNVSKITTGLNP